MQTTLFLAQATAGAGAPGGMMGMLVPMLIIFALFYFMMIRPQQRRQKEQQKMISELRAGQRVLFAQGLIGTITEAKPYTFMIEISNGVRIEVVRGSVSRVLKDGETAVEQPQS